MRAAAIAALLSLGTLAPSPSPLFAQSAAPSFEIEGNRLKLPAPIAFETATARLSSGQDAALAHVKAYLDAKSYITLMRVEGHVAGGGEGAKTQALSEARARAVADWLVGQGISCSRLLPVGFGDSKPVADASTPEGRAQNSRVEVINATLRGIAIGGMPVDGGGKVAEGWKCNAPAPAP